jgi:hypothetical protein
MSLGDTQEIMATMQEIIALLDATEVKVKDIKAEVGGSEDGGEGDLSLRRELRIMNMYMIAIQRFSGSDDLSQIFNKIQSVSAAALRLQMLLSNIQKVQAAMAAAKIVGSGGLNPWAWAELGANAVGLGMSLSTLGQ